MKEKLMSDEKFGANADIEVEDEIDGIEADFDDASTTDLKKGQDHDHTGDVPNGGI